METGQKDPHVHVRGSAWDEFRRGSAQMGRGFLNLLNASAFVQFELLIIERWLQPLYLLGSLVLLLTLLVRLFQGRLAEVLLLLVGLLLYRIFCEALVLLLSVHRRISRASQE